MDGRRIWRHSRMSFMTSLSPRTGWNTKLTKSKTRSLAALRFISVRKILVSGPLSPMNNRWVYALLLVMRTASSNASTTTMASSTHKTSCYNNPLVTPRESLANPMSSPALVKVVSRNPRTIFPSRVSNTPTPTSSSPARQPSQSCHCRSWPTRNHPTSGPSTLQTIQTWNSSTLTSTILPYPKPNWS